METNWMSHKLCCVLTLLLAIVLRWRKAWNMMWQTSTHIRWLNKNLLFIFFLFFFTKKIIMDIAKPWRHQFKSHIHTSKRKKQKCILRCWFREWNNLFDNCSHHNKTTKRKCGIKEERQFYYQKRISSGKNHSMKMNSF